MITKQKLRSAVIGSALTLSLLAMMGLAAPLRGIRTFQVTCATTATQITDSKGDISAFTVFNSSATEAYIGGSDVNSTTKGMPICTAATCYDSKFSIDGGAAYCMSVGGAVVLTVTAGR